MKKVTAYIVVSIDMIQNRLAEGWQPWGQPFYLEHSALVQQAMVQYEKIVIRDMGPK